MLTQNFIKLSAVVHELCCPRGTMMKTILLFASPGSSKPSTGLRTTSQ